ncbi:LuxR C-terminal-related transcriptional regulator [Actinoallomurus vinaceus]|uniref:LuxR C-terminal-related transcriptional regulator n=1 Tax=Actinoallomurus vinaceus TaxID=1080074 RepID=A0ABP8U986_9ACTN
MGDVLFRLGESLGAGAGPGLSPDELGELLSQAIASVVPHDSFNISGMNPATGIASLGFWHRADPALRLAQRHNLYFGEDPYSPDQLARLSVPIGVISPSAPASLAQGVLSAHGVGSELRMLLRDGRGVWGMVSLLREEGGRPFGASDERALLRLTQPLIAIVRGHATAIPPQAARPDLAPGIIMVGADHAVRAVSPQARAWLRELRLPAAISDDWAATAISSEVSLAARDHHLDQTLPVACMPASYAGHWVAIHAQPLNDDGTGDVAVVIQAATGGLLLPAFAAWYSITPRERTILQKLCEGTAPKQIARGLGISLHTVNDHLKSLFRKTNTSGRDELTAAITG